MNITIVGVGALGSHLVQFLRNEDIKIKVVDFDVVEQKNVMSQFHGLRGRRAKKVTSLRQTMDFLFGKKIETVSNRLTADNVEQLLGGSDLVIDCLDNGDSRRLIQKYVRQNNIACLHGALDANGSFGRVIWDEDFVIDDEDEEGQATCENGDFLPFITITSAYLARSAQLYLQEQKKHSFTTSPAGTQRV